MSKSKLKPKLEQYQEEYPDIPKFILLNIDASLRGVKYTKKVVERAKEVKAQFGHVEEENRPSILLRDGTPFAGGGGRANSSPDGGNPYTVDIVDDKITILDGEEPIEEGEFLPEPEFYGKKTSNGTPMEKVAQSIDEDALVFHPYGYCHFWDTGEGCRYCSIPIGRVKSHDGKVQTDLQDCYETTREALKELGRWQLFHLSSGSDPGGKTPYDNEVNRVINIIKAIGRNFKTPFPVRLVSSAFSEEQQIKLAESGAAIGYEPHLEVWDEKLFKWICPGKAKWLGRDYWINSTLKAVEIFGEGKVNTQFVGGVELAQPYGFKTIDEALKSTLEGTEFFAKHGVSTSANIYHVGKNSVFYAQKQKSPGIEYHVRLARGLHDIRKTYGIKADWNEHHADTRLNRLDY